MNLIRQIAEAIALVVGTVVEDTREGPEYIVSDADPQTVAERMVKHGGFILVGEDDGAVYVVDKRDYERWYKRPWTAEAHPFEPYDEYRGLVKLSPGSHWDDEDVEDLPSGTINNLDFSDNG